MRNILSNTEDKIQTWLWVSNMGLFTSFVLIGTVITLLTGISCIPLIFTVFYLSPWWMILIFPLTIGLMGFLTFFGGVSFIEWTGGETKIFNSNS